MDRVKILKDAEVMNMFDLFLSEGGFTRETFKNAYDDINELIMTENHEVYDIVNTGVEMLSILENIDSNVGFNTFFESNGYKVSILTGLRLLLKSITTIPHEEINTLEIKYIGHGFQNLIVYVLMCFDADTGTYTYPNISLQEFSEQIIKHVLYICCLDIPTAKFKMDKQSYGQLHSQWIITVALYSVFIKETGSALTRH